MNKKLEKKKLQKQIIYINKLYHQNMFPLYMSHNIYNHFFFFS